MNPKDYTPVFDDTLREFIHGMEDKTTVSINPDYALQPSSAKVLATLFTEFKPEIYFDNPWPTWRWSYNHQVPWFRFTLADGTTVVRNSALLAVYWKWWSSNPQFAFDFSVRDIKGEV